MKCLPGSIKYKEGIRSCRKKFNTGVHGKLEKRQFLFQLSKVILLYANAKLNRLNKLALLFSDKFDYITPYLDGSKNAKGMLREKQPPKLY